MLLEELARELVPVTSQLLGGRTLNVMDTNGVIIASTEKERIGTFHRGALEAVQTGRTVSITREQLSDYPGAREGCNMPLRLNGEIIGAVGIFGNPQEIAHLARLWEAYASKAYQLEMMTNPKLEDAKIRGRIMRNLLYPREGSLQDAEAWLAERHIRLDPPLRVAVASGREGAPLSKSGIDGILRALAPFSGAESAIWGVEHDRLVCVLGGADDADGASLAAALSDLPVRLSLSGACADLAELPRAYRQAGLLHDLSVCVPSDADEPAARTACMMAEAAAQEERALSALSARALRQLRPEEWRQLLQSAARYYSENRSVGRAADALFIHKNTLQYRMRRLWSALGLESAPDFEREYAVRLLIIREKRKQGRAALE